MKLETKHILWLLVACVAIFFVHLDALPVNIMEARNFVTAREILFDDNWLLTTINGDARYQKPPLPTWLTAISASIFGLESLYALRLPAVLLAMFGVYFFYRFISKLTKHSELAFISSLILITSFYFTFAGRNGQWDIFTHGFMMAAIYFLFQFFSTSEKYYRNSLLTALFIGLSFMSKGPVSLYALLLPFVFAYGIVFKFRTFQKKWLPLLLLLVVAFVISGWWYWYTYTFDPENVARITDKETANWTSYNVKPFYYYWSFFIQTGLWTIPAFISLLYPYLKNKVCDKKAYLFSFLWTILSVALLSIIPEKKQRYLLPVILPLAFNIGFYIEYLFRSFSEMRNVRESGPVFLHFGIVGIVGILFPFVAGYLFWDMLGDYLFWYIALSAATSIVGYFILFSLYYRRIKSAFYATITFTAVILVFGLPSIGILNTNPVQKNMSQLAVWEKKNDITVYEFSAFTPEFLWFYGDKMEKVYIGDSKELRPSDDVFGVLVNTQTEKWFLPAFDTYDLEMVDEYDLNPMPLGEKGHNKRLHRYLYVVSPKQ